MPPRFYAPELDPAHTEVILPAAESQHLARVLRLTPGADVEVFDGRGHLWRARVAAVSPSAARVTLQAPAPPQPEPPCPLVVCVALLKGDAMDAVIRDATVLGATVVVPMTTARTNVPARRAESGRLHERWMRVTVAAAKQCGRARLPAIRDVTPLAQVVAQATGDWDAQWDRRLLVEPSLGAGDATHALAHACRPTVVASGPEGGWEGREVEAARRAGWTCWSLGPFTLRAEHVPLAALAVLRHAWSAAGETPASRETPGA